MIAVFFLDICMYYLKALERLFLHFTGNFLAVHLVKMYVWLYDEHPILPLSIIYRIPSLPSSVILSPPD